MDGLMTDGLRYWWIDILITLPLNSVTTLKKENLNKKVNKTVTTTEEHKMVKGEIDIKNSKDRSRSRSSTQKGTNNQGAAK